MISSSGLGQAGGEGEGLRGFLPTDIARWNTNCLDDIAKWNTAIMMITMIIMITMTVMMVLLPSGIQKSWSIILLILSSVFDHQDCLGDYHGIIILNFDGIDNKGKRKKTLVFYGRADRKIPGGFLFAFPISIFVNDYYDNDDSKFFLRNPFIKGVNFVTNQILTDLSFNIFGFIIYGFYKYHTLHL